MRLKAAFLTAAIALIGAGSAHADVTFDLGISDPNAPNGIDVMSDFVSTGGSIDIDGAINTGGAIVTAGNIIFDAGSPAPAEENWFGGFSSLPDLSPLPLSGVYGGPLFSLDLSGIGGTVSGVYSLNVGQDPNNPDSFVNRPFTIRVVPEPGTVALFASSLVGGSLLLVRRRRK
jgi:hypothetical protein